jgi:hypothetical protein
MKRTVIVGLSLFLLGFLGGFVPQYSRVSKTMQENQELRRQLVATQRSEAVNVFRNRAALLYMEVEKSNFSVASESASKFFTDLRAFTNQSADVSLKQNLEDILSVRDSIIGGLAKPDPAVTAQIRELFLKMQNIEPRDSSKN